MYCSLPGSSVHGILQARILEWAAMPSSRGIFPTKEGSNPRLLRLLLWHSGSLPLAPPEKPKSRLGFPSWLSGKEFACHFRRPRFRPWSQKIPRATEQLSPCATTIELSLSQWCYLTISSSDVSFSSCPQLFPASGSCPVNQLFTSGGQSIGALASALVHSMNIQGWFPFGLTGLITLLSKGLEIITIGNHRFCSAHATLWCNSHIRMRLLEKP